MPRKRKNKCEWRRGHDGEQKWFTCNVRRQRRRNELAKASRKRNRTSA
jgi:hypothetical protein